jgi:hypothetical protein
MKATIACLLIVGSSCYADFRIERICGKLVSGVIKEDAKLVGRSDVTGRVVVHGKNQTVYIASRAIVDDVNDKITFKGEVVIVGGKFAYIGKDANSLAVYSLEDGLSFAGKWERIEIE